MVGLAASAALAVGNPAAPGLQAVTVADRHTLMWASVIFREMSQVQGAVHKMSQSIAMEMNVRLSRRQGPQHMS